jgi:hypothetical protein
MATVDREGGGLMIFLGCSVMTEANKAMWQCNFELVVASGAVANRYSLEQHVMRLE